MKSAVLGIGTELTDGQIINKNAAWISQKLKSLGLQTSAHLVVPDDQGLILKALNFCAEHADILFVTGGLGPTSDDFTRDVVAQWAGVELEFHEPSWQHVKDRLTSRGYTVKDIQRQQCYFPRESQVLINNEGTANGFSFNAKGKTFFVLPGPPREIAAIWESFIHNWLQDKSSSLDPHLVRLWETLGVGESDIAVLVEEALKNVDIDRGYRVHLPYVEVKLMYPRSREKDLASAFEAVDQALQFCTFSKTDEDTAVLLARQLNSVRSLEIFDEVTGSYLINRIVPAFRDYMSKDNSWSFTNDPLSLIYESDMQLGLRVIDEHTCEVFYSEKGRVARDHIVAPYKTANMRERRMQYFAERALIFWYRQIS